MKTIYIAVAHPMETYSTKRSRVLRAFETESDAQSAKSMIEMCEPRFSIEIEACEMIYTPFEDVVDQLDDSEAGEAA